jgi:ferredoxin
MPVPPSEELRPVARARIAEGTLPAQAPREVLAGCGSGGRCNLCDTPIEGSEVEYQVIGSGNADGRTYRFHVRCQEIWAEECQG